MNNEMLSNHQLKVFAAQLLTPEYSGRVELRLQFLYNQYVQTNGLYMFEVICNALTAIQEHINVIIQRHDSEVIDVYKDKTAYNKFLIQETFNRESLLKLRTQTAEETAYLRRTKAVMRYMLYGQLIKEANGYITWSEVNDIIQKVSSFVIEKKSQEGQPQQSFNRKSNKPVTDSDEDAKTLKDILIFPTDLDKYLQILREYSVEQKIQVINNNNEWCTGKVGRYLIVIAWFDALFKANLLKKNVTSKEAARLLNNTIRGLDLKEDGSLIGKTSTKRDIKRDEIVVLLKK